MHSAWLKSCDLLQRKRLGDPEAEAPLPEIFAPCLLSHESLLLRGPTEHSRVQQRQVRPAPGWSSQVRQPAILGTRKYRQHLTLSLRHVFVLTLGRRLREVCLLGPALILALNSETSSSTCPLVEVSLKILLTCLRGTSKHSYLSLLSGGTAELGNRLFVCGIPMSCSFDLDMPLPSSCQTHRDWFPSTIRPIKRHSSSWGLGVLPGLVQAPALPQKVQLPKQRGSRQRPDLAGAHTTPLLAIVKTIVVQGSVATAPSAATATPTVQRVTTSQSWQTLTSVSASTNTPRTADEKSTVSDHTTL